MRSSEGRENRPDDRSLGRRRSRYHPTSRRLAARASGVAALSGATRPRRGLRPRLLRDGSPRFGWKLGGDLRRSGGRRALTAPGSLWRFDRVLVPVVAFGRELRFAPGASEARLALPP